MSPARPQRARQPYTRQEARDDLHALLAGLPAITACRGHCHGLCSSADGAPTRLELALMTAGVRPPRDAVHALHLQATAAGLRTRCRSTSVLGTCAIEPQGCAAERYLSADEVVAVLEQARAISDRWVEAGCASA